MVICHGCHTEFGARKNESVIEGLAPVNDYFGVPSANTTRMRTGIVKCPECGKTRELWREYPDEMSGKVWLNRQGKRWLD